MGTRITRSMSKPSTTPATLPSKILDKNRVTKHSRRMEASRRFPESKPTLLPSARPSQGWKSSDAPYYPIYKAKIQEIFDTANWEFLRSEAMECHRMHSEASGDVTCEIHRDRFSLGANNLVLEVSFSDLTYWIVRILLPRDSDQTRKEVLLLSEIQTIQFVQERTSIPVPTIFGYNFKGQESENPFGYCYAFMSFMPGLPLDHFLWERVPEQYLAKVADQFADIIHQLGKITFSKIGRLQYDKSRDKEPKIITFDALGFKEGVSGWHSIGPFSTSLEYFYATRQHENACVRAGIAAGDFSPDDEELILTACKIMDHALCSSVDMKQINGPFPLQHMDLDYHNILLDEDFNITGVVDWTSAQTVPREAFCGGEELRIPPLMPKEKADRLSVFRDMVCRAWKEKDLNSNKDKSERSMSENVGSTRSQIIDYTCANGYLHRFIVYGQRLVRLLYGPKSSLEDFKEHLGKD